MSNENSEMYNPEIKDKFLSKYPPKSQAIYKSVFEKTKQIETSLQKNLYDFNENQLNLLFSNFCFNYTSVARSYGRIVTKFIDWAMENDFAKITSNPLGNVKTSWFDQFVSGDKLYFTNDEIEEYEDDCVNYQDKVIIRLIFEGAQGKAAAELCNLKKSDIIDIEENNQIFKGLLLTNEDGSTRELIVSERCLDFIEKASNEKTYYKSNGNMNFRENIRDHTDLNDTEYVIRSSNTKKDQSSGPVDKFVIYRRLTNVEKQLGLTHFNLKNLSRSGMLKQARDMMINHGTLHYMDFHNIAEYYNVNSSHSLRIFITEDNVRNLYPEDF